MNNVEQQVTGGPATTTAVPGQVVTTPAQPGAITTTAPNTIQAPGTAGTVVNQAGTAVMSPPNAAQGAVTTGTPVTPGVVNSAVPNATTYSSNYYAPGGQQGVIPGTGTGTAATPGYTGQRDAGHGRV